MINIFKTMYSRTHTKKMDENTDSEDKVQT